MDTKEPNKKNKQSKSKSLELPNSETSSVMSKSDDNNEDSSKPRCPLLAKDSEWVDILQTSPTNSKSIKNNDQEVLQLAECQDESQAKPLALMFPGLLEKDPEMFEGILNKVMSTTEVTKHLVGQKANFAFMKKVNRLIPTDKKWLESLTETSTSHCSMESNSQDNGLSDFEEEKETSHNNFGSQDST